MRWTKQQEAALVEGWREGLSSGQIARKVGGEATRSKVARKRSRLGLPARTGALAEAAMRVNGRRSETGLRATPSPGRGIPKGVAKAVRLGPLQGSTPRPWVLRAYGECCFPVAGSGADTLSCCEPVEGPAGVYCWRHKAILRGDQAVAALPA